MALNFHARLTADGRQAKSEIKGTADELRKLDTALDGVEAEGRGAASALGSLEARAGAAGMRLTDTGGAARAVGDAHNGAARHVGNLTSQFNDIGVMLASGQNPLQLAIQQGTQIGQVFQQTGAKGRDALLLIVGGLTSMLSPINLVTIGSIAAGAAMVNWLSGASEDAESLEDVLERLSGRVDQLRTRSSQSAQQIAEEFGSVSPAVARMLMELREGDLDAIERDSERAAQSLIQSIGQQALNVAHAARQAGDRAGYDAIKEAGLELDDATGLGERIRALEAVKRAVAAVASENENVLAAQDAVRDSVAETEVELRRAITARERVAEGLKDFWTSVSSGARDYLATRLEEYRQGSEILTSLQEQNELKRIALMHGEDSVEYAEAHAAAERRAFEAILDTLTVSESLKDELRAAFEQGLALSQIDVASGLWEGANAASAIALNLAGAVDQMNALAQKSIASAGASARRSQIMLDTVGNPVERAGALAVQDYREQLDDGGYGLISSGRAGDLAANESAIRQEAEHAESLAQAAQAAEAEYRKLQTALSGGGAGGGARGETGLERQKKAVENLIASQRDELAILRETDPVQQEMIRLRATLAGATDEQRAAIEANIATMQAERAAQEEVQQIRDQVGGGISDLVHSSISGGDQAADAWQRFGQVLMDIAIQAAIVQPLLQALGLATGGGGGGILRLFGFAEGGDPFSPDGMIHGQGGPKQDRRVVAVSPGEFIVKADAANRHRAMLEAINADAPIPGFAQGGFVTGGAAPGTMVLQTQIIDQSSRGLDIREERETLPDGRRLQRFTIADLVGGAQAQPGGRAREQLRASGVRPPMARR